MVKCAKVTRIVAPLLVFVSMVFAIVAIATGDSMTWLVGDDIEAENNFFENGDPIDNDPFFQHCNDNVDASSPSCQGLTRMVVQLEFYLGRSRATYCDALLPNCEGSDEFPVILDQSYDDFMFDENDNSTAFVMLYDGCPIGSITVQVTVSLGIILMFGSLVLDALSFKRRFDKPRISTFLLVLGWAFMLAGVVSWVLTCQNTSSSLYPDITIGLGFIFLIISVAIGFVAGAIRVLRVEDFKYQAQVYI